MKRQFEPILRIEGLRVGFGMDKIPVLRDVSLLVYPNDRIGVIGETGSGKSVLLLSLLQLLPANAQIEGSAFFHGLDLLGLSRKTLDGIRGNKISYIAQGSGNSMNPLINVGAQVGEPLVIHHQYTKAKSFDRAIELLRRFNIGDEERRAKMYPHSFSGGMRQRAMIAMGISGGAELLLADEPTKGLDVQRIKMVEETFRTLEDRAYICVTHDLNFAQNISEKLLVMHSSYVVEEGPTEEVFNRPLHPYTESIIQAMPENGCVVLQERMDHSIVESGCSYRKNCIYAMDQCMKTPPYFSISQTRKVRCWKYAEM